MTRRLWPCLLLGLALPAWAAELSGTYSQRRFDGDHLHGAALALRWPQRGPWSLVSQAVFHDGTALGEDRREWALLTGPAFSFGRGRLSVSVHAQAGLASERRQVVVFGVAVGPQGVCAGACPSRTAFAAETGAGLDLRLGTRWGLRLAQADRRLTRLDGDAGGRWRLSAGLTWRFALARRPK